MSANIWLKTRCADHLLSFLELWVFVFLSIFIESSAIYDKRVFVFYHIKHVWGIPIAGDQRCGYTFGCTWSSAESITELQQQATRIAGSPLSVGVINLHVYGPRKQLPSYCNFSVNFTLGTSEESRSRYSQRLFNKMLPKLDGSVIPHSNATVQRIYQDAYLNETSFFPLIGYSKLIKGGSFVALNCAQRKGGSSRIAVVEEVRRAGVRVDGLGSCLKTDDIPEKVEIGWSNNAAEKLRLKQKAIGRYMFNMAFENVVEPGYVTEKPFDALIAGKCHKIIWASDCLTWCIEYFGFFLYIHTDDSCHLLYLLFTSWFRGLTII
jgi:hypothetical protein